MQRIRMSLSYFKEFNWDAEVITVDQKYSEISKDYLLMQSLPIGVKIHQIAALKKSFTSKIGLGSIALRSLWNYRKKVNQLLKAGNIDLIYFSTTQFPVCVLGAYWKKKFDIPYIIDMQDPWHSDYYKNKPKHEQPPKYWFSYQLNKYLELIAMKHVDGLIAVSKDYISTLNMRYPETKDIPSEVIPFGDFPTDRKIAIENSSEFKKLLSPDHINIVYIGRGGADMRKAISSLFSSVKNGLLTEGELFKYLRFYFIGTSYAPDGQGNNTVLPIAAEFGIEDMVIEITDRISFYHTLETLQQADALFVPGSDDPKYTASKIYPYISTRKPLLAIFNSKSPALNILEEYGAKFAYSYDATEDIGLKILAFLKKIITRNVGEQHYNENVIKKYSAENMTKRQCMLFDKTINKNI